MSNPLVSVIIPTYNRAHLVKNAVKSALKQSYKNLEIVIVDDNSNDGTVSMLKEALKHSIRVKIYRLNKNMGEVGARNYGIIKSKGSLITFLDSDDVLTPESIADRVLAYQVCGYKKPLVYGNFLINNQARSFKHLKGMQYKYLLRELSLCGIVAVLLDRRELLKIGLPDETLPSWGDDDLIIKYAKYHPIYHINSIVAHINSSSDSVSLNPYNNRVGCEKIVEKYKNDIIGNHGYFRYFLWKIRIIRLKLLEVKFKLSQDSGMINLIVIYFIRMIMFVLDKILFLWFDNIFV